MAHSKITKNIRNSCGGAWNSERRIAQYYCKSAHWFLAQLTLPNPAHKTAAYYKYEQRLYKEWFSPIYTIDNCINRISIADQSRCSVLQSRMSRYEGRFIILRLAFAIGSYIYIYICVGDYIICSISSANLYVLYIYTHVNVHSLGSPDNLCKSQETC